MKGWGWSCRGEVGHAEVGWVVQGWMGHAGIGWGGSCWDGVGWIISGLSRVEITGY